MIKIISFGQIAEIIGSSEIRLDASDTDDLRQQLCEKHPQLLEKKYVLAVNKNIISDTVLLSPNDEVALLPPFSGG